MNAALDPSLFAAPPRPSVLDWLQSHRSVPLAVIIGLHAAAAVFAVQTSVSSPVAAAAPKEIFATFITQAPQRPPQPEPPKPEPPKPVVAPKPPPVVKKTVKPKPQKPTPKSISAPVEPTPTPPPQPVAEPVSAPVSAPVAPAPVAAAPAPAEPAPPKMVSGVEYIQAPRPDYPMLSKRMGEQGKVVLRILVNQRGRPDRVDIQRSSGFTRLDEAAKQAAMRAVFKPYTENGRPVAVYALVPINFSLD